MRILITGTAGFIGFHLARKLIALGHAVTGIDGMTPYYDVSLKRRRHSILNQTPSFVAHELMLEDVPALAEVWKATNPDVVIHLAAQAGVRYSLENPRAYIDANLIGSFNILELVRSMPVRHLLIASTSSVYGANPEMPFRESDKADSPLTLYAATKKAVELMGHSYSHLFSIPMTFFRFFTVYGPWGRPDMALFKFTAAILKGEPIEIYNHGNMARDFTFVDDIVEGIVRLIDVVPPSDPKLATDGDTLSAVAPCRVVNIGNGVPVPLLDLIEAIEACTGRKAVKSYLPMQPGDVPSTFASSDLLERLTGFRPSTPLSVGVRRFVEWYREAYGA
jgi:UDP-glucuronate 4-epimerase